EPPEVASDPAAHLRWLLSHGDLYQPGAPGAEADLDARVADILNSQNPNLGPSGSFDFGMGVPTPGSAPGVPDPGAMGSLAIQHDVYNSGDSASPPSDPRYPATFPVEVTAEVTSPTDLGQDGQLHPLIVFLHGRHGTTYLPPTGGGVLEWPPAGGRVSIPSYLGYDYLGDVLASHGYIVGSLRPKGINARGKGTFDAGMLARAELVERHLDIWNDLNRDGVVHGFGADQSPFGTHFVGHVDMQNIGTMGHSRGGQGVVQNFQLNQA